ncbi:MAG: dihydroorotate dehydrogenase electron transfer subunit [Firmicutes bacterium]|mgnify:CR=1 FL=1|nr:dihydroorotate dehydrogenase electron transfer subunit [Bacillota bacterium]
MMFFKGQVKKITELTFNQYCLLLENLQAAKKAVPGQFLHIRIREGLAPFLRRPFSIAGTSPREGTVSVIFRIVGEGTAMLSHLQPGENLDCLGPLGSGFETIDKAACSVLIAGGIGAAPLLFLARKLTDEKKKVFLFYGASTASELIPLKKYLPSEVEIHWATEDGSAGYEGLVTGLFVKALKKGLKPEEIFACGPRPMLQALALKNDQWNFPLQLSLEERMACGIGACQGCALKTKSGDEIGYRMVCRDGPVFHSYEVVW